MVGRLVAAQDAPIPPVCGLSCCDARCCAYCHRTACHRSPPPLATAVQALSSLRPPTRQPLPSRACMTPISTAARSGSGAKGVGAAGWVAVMAACLLIHSRSPASAVPLLPVHAQCGEGAKQHLVVNHVAGRTVKILSFVETRRTAAAATATPAAAAARRAAAPAAAAASAPSATAAASAAATVAAAVTATPLAGECSGGRRRRRVQQVEAGGRHSRRLGEEAEAGGRRSRRLGQQEEEAGRRRSLRRLRGRSRGWQKERRGGGNNAGG